MRLGREFQRKLGSVVYQGNGLLAGPAQVSRKSDGITHHGSASFVLRAGIGTNLHKIGERLWVGHGERRE